MFQNTVFRFNQLKIVHSLTYFEFQSVLVVAFLSQVLANPIGSGICYVDMFLFILIGPNKALKKYFDHSSLRSSYYSDRYNF